MVKKVGFLVLRGFIFFSVFSVMIIVNDINQPECYSLLFLLPLSFMIISIIFFRIYTLIPNNLGATIIIILFFVRMVITPLLMRLGNYNSTIELNIDKNTSNAIFLCIYENFCVFFIIWLFLKRFFKRWSI